MVVSVFDLVPEKVKEVLDGSGVVLIPTDTVYGLAALASLPNAGKKIFDLKARPGYVNLPIMVSKIEQVEEMGFDINPAAETLLKSDLVPGDLTLVLGFSDEKQRPSWLDGREEAAIRIPNDEFLLKVLDVSGPLLVTSANKHGSPVTPGTVEEILKQLNGRPELCIEGKVSDELRPSTIVNCRKNPPVIERQGSLDSEIIFNTISNG